MLCWVSVFTKHKSNFREEVWYPQEAAKAREVLEKNYIFDETNMALDNYALARDIKAQILASGIIMNNTWNAKVGNWAVDALFEFMKLEKSTKKIGGRYLTIWYGLRPKEITES